jgi:hypothetical protein
MGRPKKEPTRPLKIHAPESLYAEMMLLKPELQDVHGFTRYGSLTNYCCNLIRKDLEAIKESYAANVAIATKEK